MKIHNVFTALYATNKVLVNNQEQTTKFNLRFRTFNTKNTILVVY